jgi:hypothetical protein
MRTDRQTDMTNLIVTFRNFANAPKNTVHGQISHMSGDVTIKIQQGTMLNLMVTYFVLSITKYISRYDVQSFHRSLTVPLYLFVYLLGLFLVC